MDAGTCRRIVAQVARTRFAPSIARVVGLAAVALLLVYAARVPFPSLAAEPESRPGSLRPTAGGLVSGSKLLRVDTLADDGPGSLRVALDVSGPRIIVFETAGVIELNSPLDIFEPNVTVAGETAPSPGISLVNGTVRVRASDVELRHLAIRPGPAPLEEDNADRDGLNIGGKDRLGRRISGVLARNLSVSHAVDENVSIWAEGTRDVTVTDSLIAEALREAGHPKGQHSMGLIVGSGARNVRLEKNLFVSNMFRNPRISPDVSAGVFGNGVHNPGQQAVQVHLDCDGQALPVVLEGNALREGRDTNGGLGLYTFFDGQETVEPSSEGRCDEAFAQVTIGPDRPSIHVGELTITAGSRPADRDAIDRAIVEDVRRGTARVTDNARSTPEDAAMGRDEIGPWRPPGKIVAEQPLTSVELDVLARSLCEREALLSVAPPPFCPDGP